MEPEICTKMLKKLSEKLRAKFPAMHYTWLLHGKKLPVTMMLSQNVLNWKAN